MLGSVFEGITWTGQSKSTAMNPSFSRPPTTSGSLGSYAKSSGLLQITRHCRSSASTAMIVMAVPSLMSESVSGFAPPKAVPGPDRQQVVRLPRLLDRRLKRGDQGAVEDDLPAADAAGGRPSAARSHSRSRT